LDTLRVVWHSLLVMTSQKDIPSYSIESLKAGARHAEAMEFDLFRFEYFARDLEHLKTPHRHDFFTFILVTGGSGSHDIDFTTYSLQPNRLFLMAPGQVHAWNTVKQVGGFVLFFTDSFVALSKGRKLLSSWPLFQPGQKCFVDLTNKEVALWVSKFQELEEEFGRTDHFMEDALFYGIGHLLVRASRLYESAHAQQSPQRDLLFRFQGLIEKHSIVLKTPKEYASLLHVTPNYLNSFCKRNSGKSAGELIRQRILLEAKRLLAHTQLPAAQVAYQLNFNDNSYFGRFFKKYAGMTPEAFRNGQQR